MLNVGIAFLRNFCFSLMVCVYLLVSLNCMSFCVYLLPFMVNKVVYIKRFTEQKKLKTGKNDRGKVSFWVTPINLFSPVFVCFSF